MLECMKTSERIILLVSALTVGSLVVYRTQFMTSPAKSRWRECAPDAETRCGSAAPGVKPTAVAKCLVENYEGLAPSCQQFVSKFYKSALAAKTKESQPKAEAKAVDINKILAPCRKFWSPECNKKSDKTGENVACYSSQPDFAQFSAECINVMVDVVQWAPAACAHDKLAEICPKVWGLQRLQCALKRADKFGPECQPWLKSVSRIVKERTRR
jgi:hypothetical protein